MQKTKSVTQKLLSLTLALALVLGLAVMLPSVNAYAAPGGGEAPDAPATEEPTADEPTADEPTTEVNLFSFNDFHGTVDNSASTSNPGMARFTAIAKHIMGQYPNSMLLAAGDNYQGSAISNYFLGEPVSRMMKELGVKYSAVGNHDYDWGPDKFAKFSEDAGGMTFLAANIFLKGTNVRPDYCEPYATVEVNGKKIGIVGWANTGTPTLVTARYVADVEFRSNSGTWFVDAVNAWKAQEGWDAVIALTHGTLSGANLAGVINGIITGHSHSVSTTATNGIPTVQAGYNGRNLGRLRLMFDNVAGTVSVTSSTFANFTNSSILPTGQVDPVAKAIYDEYFAIADPIFSEQVGVFGQNIANGTQMGLWANQLVYDFIERNTGEDDYILIQNSGGWRSVGYGRTPEEPVDYWFLNTLMPFDNEIYLFQLRGDYLMNFLRGRPASGTGSLGSSPVITNAHGSGNDWYITSTGEKIDPAKLYKVSFNDFMFTGGDNYGVESIAVFDYETLIMGVPLREAMAMQLRYRMFPYTYGALSALVGTWEFTDVKGQAEFDFWLRNLNHANTISIEFILSGGILEFARLECFSGFAAMPITWTDLGEGDYKGEVALVLEGTTITAPACLACELFFDAKDLGDATITLTKVTVTSQPIAGGEIVREEARLEKASATTSVIKVYSVFDINQDGKIDQLDLAIVALACGAYEGSPLWDKVVATVGGKPITASMCDVNGDGEVDIQDLLDLYLHYGDY